MEGLIVSVGGSTEPVVKSIEHSEPEFICFYCSQGSVETIGKIKSEVEYDSFEDVKVLVDDPENLDHCYEKATKTIQKLFEVGIYPNNAVVDYTGGTKVMASALVAATLGEGFNYLYVGGGQRNKGGLGYVEDGTEEILSSRSPWRIHALEAKKKIQRDFNTYRFESVVDQLESLERKGLESERDEHLLSAVLLLAEGYSQWERFHYEDVKDKLKTGREMLETYQGLTESGEDLNFTLETVEKNLEFLSALQGETAGYDFENRIGRSLPVDMFWNAVRRAEEGKYDDGIVRLYRTVEIFGQVEIFNELGCHTGEVPLDRLPEEIRGDFRKRTNKQGEVKLGLNDTFRVLSKLDNKVGQDYLKQKESFKGIMGTRNNSFLTHNFRALSEKQFESHREMIAEIFDIDREVRFPKLDIS